MYACLQCMVVAIFSNKFYLKLDGILFDTGRNIGVREWQELMYVSDEP